MAVDDPEKPTWQFKRRVACSSSFTEYVNVSDLRKRYRAEGPFWTTGSRVMIFTLLMQVDGLVIS